MKAQSAMEYLMTYGWAILIISLALVALYELGVFNPMNSAPKAHPGSCSVYRPSGPGTVAQISLSGICTGEIPQFVPQLASTTCPAGGDPVYISQLTSTSANAVTEAFWASPTAASTATLVGMSATSSPLSCSTSATGTVTCGSTSYPAALQTNKWSFIVITASGGASANDYLYVNGQQVANAASGWTTGPMGISGFNIFSAHGASGSSCFAGLMSNVQLYSTALSSNSVKALYLEGIGGAPIDLQDLVGWWPLNGDIKDYSGNQNSGVSNGIIFNGQWWGGYNQP